MSSLSYLSLFVTIPLLVCATSAARHVVNVVPVVAPPKVDVTKRSTKTVEFDQYVKFRNAEGNEVVYRAPPTRRSSKKMEMDQSVSFVYPKGKGVINKAPPTSKRGRRGPSRVFNVSVHEVPSGPNPISNR